MIHGFALVQSLCLPFGDLQLLDGVIFFEYEFCDRSVFCSTSIVRRNMRRLDAECRRCEAREISNPQPPTPAASCTERPAGAGWI